MEKLDQHLRANKITRCAFAELVGIGKATLTELMQKKYIPRADVAVRIEDATGGDVTVRDLLGG